jgi:hypothetical protein
MASFRSVRTGESDLKGRHRSASNSPFRRLTKFAENGFSSNPSYTLGRGLAASSRTVVTVRVERCSPGGSFPQRYRCETATRVHRVG